MKKLPVTPSVFYIGGSISCLCLHKNDRLNPKTSRFVAASSLFGTELKGASSMVTKSKKEMTVAKNSRVKVPKLKLKKETIKNLQDGDLKKIRGGGTSIKRQTAAPTSFC